MTNYIKSFDGNNYFWSLSNIYYFHWLWALQMLRQITTKLDRQPHKYLFRSIVLRYLLAFPFALASQIFNQFNQLPYIVLLLVVKLDKCTTPFWFSAYLPHCQFGAYIGWRSTQKASGFLPKLSPIVKLLELERTKICC